MTRLPLYYNGVPKNREQKRQFKFEYKRNVRYFDEIEMAFLDEIFSEEGMESALFRYQKAYSVYLTLWNKEIARLEKQNKLKHTYIDKDYFSDTYAPVEEESNKTNFYTWVRKIL